MLYAMTEKQQLIFAKDAQKNQCYYCPGCGRHVILKQGALKLAHFAHQKAACQIFSEGETDEHLKGKQLLAKWFRQQGCQVWLEAYLSKLHQRPDLLIKKPNGIYQAIEFQCAPLSLAKLKQRTLGYARLGLSCWWILGHRYYVKNKLTQQNAQFLRFHPNLGYYLTYITQDNDRLLLVYDLQCDDFLQLQKHYYYAENIRQLQGFYHRKHIIKYGLISASKKAKQIQKLQRLCWQKQGKLHDLQIACYEQRIRLQDVYPKFAATTYQAPLFCQYPFSWKIKALLQKDKCCYADLLTQSLFETPLLKTDSWRQRQIEQFVSLL